MNAEALVSKGGGLGKTPWFMRVCAHALGPLAKAPDVAVVAEPPAKKQKTGGDMCNAACKQGSCCDGMRQRESVADDANGFAETCGALSLSTERPTCIILPRCFIGGPDRPGLDRRRGW